MHGAGAPGVLIWSKRYRTGGETGLQSHVGRKGCHRPSETHPGPECGKEASATTE